MCVVYSSFILSPVAAIEECTLDFEIVDLLNNNLHATIANCKYMFLQVNQRGLHFMVMGEIDPGVSGCQVG